MVKKVLSNEKMLRERLMLIEVATKRPDDIKSFYDKYLIHIHGGCSFLDDNAPSTLSVLYKGKLVEFDPCKALFLLADKNPDGPRTCGIHGCLTVDHVSEKIIK